MADSDDPTSLQAEAKRLLRTTRAATLATLDGDGAPFASLTSVATMPDGAPILLLSRLAQHTLHLEADPRCSLLLAASGRGDPLAHPRLTLVGTVSLAVGETRATARRRFLAHNPKAELYADFPDFAFSTVTLSAAHLNGGFGRAARFTAPEVLTDTTGCDALLAGEEGAVAHMNADHGDATKLYAMRLLRLPDRDWRLSGLDPEGLDLVAGDMTARLPFPDRVADGPALRRLLVTLVTDARNRPD